MAESNTASNTEQITKTLDPTLLLKDELDQVSRIYNIIVEFFTNYSFQIIHYFYRWLHVRR